MKNPDYMPNHFTNSSNIVRRCQYTNDYSDMHSEEKHSHLLDEEGSRAATPNPAVTPLSSSDRPNEVAAYRVVCIITSLAIFGFLTFLILPFLRSDPQWTAPFGGSYYIMAGLVAWKFGQVVLLSTVIDDGGCNPLPIQLQDCCLTTLLIPTMLTHSKVFDLSLACGICQTPVEILIYMGFYTRTIIALSILSIFSACLPTISLASTLAPARLNESRGVVAMNLLLYNVQKERPTISFV